MAYFPHESQLLKIFDNVVLKNHLMSISLYSSISVLIFQMFKTFEISQRYLEYPYLFFIADHNEYVNSVLQSKIMRRHTLNIIKLKIFKER